MHPQWCICRGSFKGVGDMAAIATHSFRIQLSSSTKNAPWNRDQRRRYCVAYHSGCLPMSVVAPLMTAAWAWEGGRWYHFDHCPRSSSVSAVSSMTKCTVRLRRKATTTPLLLSVRLLSLRRCFHCGLAVGLPESTAGATLSARQAWTLATCRRFNDDCAMPREWRRGYHLEYRLGCFSSDAVPSILI